MVCCFRDGFMKTTQTPKICRAGSRSSGLAIAKASPRGLSYHSNTRVILVLTRWPLWAGLQAIDWSATNADHENHSHRSRGQGREEGHQRRHRSGPAAARAPERRQKLWPSLSQVIPQPANMAATNKCLARNHPDRSVGGWILRPGAEDLANPRQPVGTRLSPMS